MEKLLQRRFASLEYKLSVLSATRDYCGGIDAWRSLKIYGLRTPGVGINACCQEKFNYASKSATASCLFVLSVSRSPGRGCSIHIAEWTDKGYLQRCQIIEVTHANEMELIWVGDGCRRLNMLLRTLELFLKTKKTDLGQSQKFGEQEIFSSASFRFPQPSLDPQSEISSVNELIRVGECSEVSFS